MKPIILARMIDFVVVLVFLSAENRLFASIYFFNGKWLRSFTYISPMYRYHPFIILDEELFQEMNDSSSITGFTQLSREYKGTR